MRLRRENLLWNVLLGSGVYLLDSLRDRLSSGMDDLSDRARDTYGEASKRVSRASEAIRGEDHSALGTAALYLTMTQDFADPLPQLGGSRLSSHPSQAL